MPFVTLESGEQGGKTFPFQDKLLIGRHPQAHIPLTDLKVSRQHCVIYAKNGRYILEDLKSTNGTSVNGRLIRTRQELQDGDIIRVGLSWFRFHLDESGDDEQSLKRAFSQYKFLEKIGEGGMAFIYRAIHIPLEREVALKILPPKKVRENPKLKELFLREALVLHHFSHENIAILLDFGINGPYYYFSMELVEGISLEDYIALHGSLDNLEAVTIALQVARGLNHAYQKGFLHRDVKPRNIMLNREKQVKIVDFGLAKAVAEEAESNSLDQEFLGTLEYISPEQAENKPLDVRSDIYSFGITLYQMLSGSTPFQGDTPYTLIRKHLEVEPPPLDSLVPVLDPELKLLVERCLAKDPEERYPDWEHLIRDLERVRECIREAEEEEQRGELTYWESLMLSFFLLLQDRWFPWTFFPLVGLILAILFQFVI